jgi:hypothetical protein
MLYPITEKLAMIFINSPIVKYNVDLININVIHVINAIIIPIAIDKYVELDNIFFIFSPYTDDSSIIYLL